MRYAKSKDIPEETIDAWVEAYESGESISTLSAKEAAKNSALGFHTIRKKLIERGVKLRTHKESLKAMTRNLSWKR